MTEPSRWYTSAADDDLVCSGPDGCGARVADLELHEQDHRRREQMAAIPGEHVPRCNPLCDGDTHYLLADG